MFIKFCGFTREQDLEAAAALPISAAGFVFHRESPRYVEPQRAAELIKILHGTGIAAAGIFVNHNRDSILGISDTAGLDMVQVYGIEKARELGGSRTVIACHRVSGGHDDCSIPEVPEGQMLLLDTFVKGAAGGTGRSFDWDILKRPELPGRLIVAGGLNCKNIGKLIREVNPFGVDISSGIETAPGIKSETKMKEIIQQIKEAQDEQHA